MITQKISNEHFRQASNCLAKGFLREPMTQVLNITFEEMKTFCDAVITFAIEKTNLSFIAVDQDNNVIGVIINKDFIENPIDENIKLNEKFFPIFKLLDELDLTFQKTRKITKGEYFHSLMIAVDEDCKIKNISTLLQNASFEEAKQLGFKYAVLEATGPISQHIAQNKFGYKLNNEIKYKDYLFNNEFVFQTIETNESCQLLVKEF